MYSSTWRRCSALNLPSSFLGTANRRGPAVIPARFWSVPWHFVGFGTLGPDRDERGPAAQALDVRPDLSESLP
jgi:hypothetical protein